MPYTLSPNIKVGERIKTADGWRKVRKVTDEGVIVKGQLFECLISFGDTIYGWKSK